MDQLEVIITEEDLEISFDDGIELVFADDVLELLVLDDAEILVTHEVIELLLDSEPGIPPGGLVGEVLTKSSNVPFAVEWTPITKITVGTTAPISPKVGDLWVDTN